MLSSQLVLDPTVWTLTIWIMMNLVYLEPGNMIYRFGNIFDISTIIFVIVKATVTLYRLSIVLIL